MLAPHPFFQARGTPIAVRTVLEFLSTRGHRVDVLTFPEGEDLDVPNCRFYRVRRLPKIRNVRPGFSLKKVAYDFLLLIESLRMIRRCRYDAIHAVEEAALIAAMLRKVSGIPYVYDMDSSLPEQMVERFPGLRFVFGALRAMEGLAVKQSLGVLTVCSSLEDVVRHHDPRKVVGRVEDTSLLAPSTANGRNTRSLPATQQGPVAMYVGNLEPYQGIDLLLHGFRHTLERVPNAQLVIVGGRPDDIEMYREQADRLGILHSAEFLGPRPLTLLPGLLRQAVVLVSPRVRGHQHPDEDLLVPRLGDAGARHPTPDAHPGPGRRDRLSGRARPRIPWPGAGASVPGPPPPAAAGPQRQGLRAAGVHAPGRAAQAGSLLLGDRGSCSRATGVSAVACGQAAADRGDWALPLFRRSVLKQAKLDQITRLLDDPAGRECLDIGADNGVISLLLRRMGGRWSSADLDERAVASIRELVGERVYRLDGARTPFPDRSFDQVVVVDYLEHIADDAAFARELARIVRPGGSVIINVPHLKPGSRLNRLRHAIGLTDAWHGHLRPGYSVEQLRRLLNGDFAIEQVATYSRTFSELVDTLLNGLYLLLQRRKTSGPPSAKGTVVTGADVRNRRGQFLLLSALYPIFWSLSRLDSLLWRQSGYKLILRARRTA